MLKTYMFLPIAVLLTACGGNVKQLSCADRDWQQEGYDTAMGGKSVRTFDSIRASCDTPPDELAKAAYIDGYTRGIIEFCSFDNGYEFGSTGRTLLDICPMEVRQQFADGYKRGYTDHAESIRRLKHMKDEQEMAEQHEAARERPTERPR